MSSTSSPSSRARFNSSNPDNQHPTPFFTSQMQDRQARNKNPYASDDDSDFDSGGGRYDAYSADSYAATQLRRDAAIKLDSPELVMMLAQARNDSIPSTRNYLTKILCGHLTQSDIDDEQAAEAERTAAAAQRVSAGQGERDARVGEGSGSGSGRGMRGKKVGGGGSGGASASGSGSGSGFGGGSAGGSASGS